MGELSAVLGTWPEPSLAHWLHSARVLSLGSSLVSLRLVFTMDGLCFKNWELGVMAQALIPVLKKQRQEDL